MATSVVNPRVQFFASNGRPLIGGRIHTYVAGSSTRARTYKDAAKAQPNTNPIILDGRGEAQIYLAEGVEYKFVVEDSKGALIYTQEPVYGAVWPNAEQWPSDATLSYQYMSEAKAAVDSMGVTRAPFDTYAQAINALPDLADGERIEVSIDETRDRARTRYKVEDGALVFVVNLDQVRLDLNSPEHGTSMVMFKHVGTGAVPVNLRDRDSQTTWLTDFLSAPVTGVAAAMELASMAAGEGGTVNLPSGRFTIKQKVNSSPVMLRGQGQGGTVLEFDMADGARDGVVFGAPSITNCEIGASNLSVELINGNGLTCWTTPSGPYIDRLAKVTFEHISYSSERTSATDDSFACLYGWEFTKRLGDSFCMTLSAIDALGSFVTAQDPATQTLDGFIRFQPSQGILSCRLSNITTHNVANFCELAGRTYFSSAQIDVARAYRGFYDATDRYYDPANPYAYGECSFDFVIVNAQKSCWDLKYRYFTNFKDCAAHRTTDGFTGPDDYWVGFSLPYARGCKLHGVHAGTSAATQGTQVGFNFEGGSGCVINGVSLGYVSHGFRLTSSVRPVEGGDSGPVRALSIADVSILGNVGTMFDMVHVRDLGIRGVRTNNQGGYTVATMLNNANPATNTFLMQDVDGVREYQPDGARILWQNPASPAGGRTWRWSMTGNTLSLLAANDVGTAGTNALIFEREAGTQNLRRVEFRAQASGGYVLFTASEAQFSGIIKPTQDNSTDVGTPTSRVKQYYGVNGTISTSDAREKTNPAIISDAVLDAWGDVQVICFQWLSAIAEKGELNARWHFGVIAQQVRDAFASHGLDGTRYGLLCYDEWDAAPAEYETISAVYDDDGNLLTPEMQVLFKPAIEAGSRWGIRADQCLFLEAAYQRREMQRLKERVSALEAN